MSLDATIHVPARNVDVHLLVESGTTLALLGPNGSGKTTILEAIAGVVQSVGAIVSGSIRLEALEPRHRGVGVVFQDLLLFPTRTALANVTLAARWAGARPAEAREEATGLLSRLRVAHRAGALPAELSGGEAQRVALARALARKPRILLLDEPVSSLDLAARAEIRSVIADELRRFDGEAIVVTHDPVDAATLAQHVAVIEDGRVTQTGTVDEIRSAPRSTYAAEFAGVNLFAGHLSGVAGGVGTLRATDGDLVVAVREGVSPGAVIGVLRPADVSLFLNRPETSARNVLEGVVVAVAVEADRARIRIASAPPLAADVTLGSLERLGLRPGTRVWAAFKAGEVMVSPG